MTNLSVLLRKEWRENIRNFKILWIPIVFLILGILEPVTNYYLPEIMKSVGNLPEGTEFPWPEFKGQDIFMSLLGQYQFIGILVIVLAFMGTISGERKNGTATLLYVRPLSFRNYFMSKWIVINGISLGSVWLGFTGGWYYIGILYNHVEILSVLAFIATYSLWIIFVVTVILVLSASLPTAGAAGLALLITLVYQIIDTVVGTYWTVSPWKLSKYASLWFDPQSDRLDFWLSSGLTILAIIIMIVLGIFMSRRNAAKTTV